MKFRLAKVPMVQVTGCLELQILLDNEDGTPEWVHYCIVKSRAQAIELVGEKNPELATDARADLAGNTVLDGITDPRYQVRIAKALLNWRDSARDAGKP